MGAINSDRLEFIGDLGRRITQVTGSVLIQRYNAVTTEGTFAHTTSEHELQGAVSAYLLLAFVFNPRDLYY